MSKRKELSKSSKQSRPPSKKLTFGEEILAGLEEVLAYRRGEIKLRTRQIHVPTADVATVRKKSGLSQLDFADRYGFNSRTLQE